MAPSGVWGFAASWPWLLLQCGAIVLDLVWMATHDQSNLGVTIFVCLVFNCDVLLRIFGLSASVYFARTKIWNWIDFFFVLILSVITFVGALELEDDRHDRLKRRPVGVGSLPSVLRLVRLVRAVVCILRATRALPVALRHQIGGTKRRFLSLTNDFDLDLTYITHRLIAMSVPAPGCVGGSYRNPISEVVRFFETYHAGHYKIFNMCPEFPYPDEAFKGDIVHFEIADHTPPRIDQSMEFLRIARGWMDLDPRNIIAVHCRGGKGRTGSFCCAWLLYDAFLDMTDSQAALDHFAIARTDLPDLAQVEVTKVATLKLQGVETPSQVRYVGYIAQLLSSGASVRPWPLPMPTSTRVSLRCLKTIGMSVGGVAKTKSVAMQLHVYLAVAVPEPGDMCTANTVCFGTALSSTSGLHSDTRVETAATALTDHTLTEDGVVGWRRIFVSEEGEESWNFGDIEVMNDFHIAVVSITAPQAEATRRETSKPGGVTVPKKKEQNEVFSFYAHASFLDGEELEIPVKQLDKAWKHIDKYSPGARAVLSFSRC